MMLSMFWAVGVWMGRNRFMFNPSRTVWLWIFQLTTSEEFPFLIVNEVVLLQSGLIHNLRSFLDSQLLLKKQVGIILSISHACFWSERAFKQSVLLWSACGYTIIIHSTWVVLKTTRSRMQHYRHATIYLQNTSALSVVLATSRLLDTIQCANYHLQCSSWQGGII